MLLLGENVIETLNANVDTGEDLDCNLSTLKS
jgi:hypothetical protein